MLTQRRLKEVLKYDPETGIFIRLKTLGNNAPAGRKAGSINKRGYWCIKLFKKQYQAHRLAWLYVYGYFPENYIDHINRNPTDNRIVNLREVSNKCNQRNSKIRIDNSSGIKGVSWVNRDKRWLADIKINNQKIHLGYFKDFGEAVCHRLAAEQAENWSGCDSYSPSFKYVENLLGGMGQ